MATGMFDPARIEYQLTQLRKLSRRRRRVALRRRAAQRRVNRGGGDGLPDRVSFQLSKALPPDADPVLVVPRQVFVRADQAQRAVELLAERGVEAAIERDGDVGRAAIVKVAGAIDLAAVVRLLRDDEIKGSANHAASHSGTSKGGGTPKNTDMIPTSPRTPGDPVSPSPLVIVIDTGVSKAALQQERLQEDNRTDAWLEDVAIDDLDDIDLLDTEDYYGNAWPDGYLDLGAGHGTFVAGVIRWHAPSANITVLRALDTDGYGTEDALAMTIERAAGLFENEDRGLLNLSLGVETIDSEPPVGLVEALSTLPDNVRVVAAAGNSPTNTPMWPAALDDVLGVASVQKTATGLTPSDWSNHGDWVDFSAPGEGVVSTYVAGTETEGSGDDDDPFDPEPDTFEGPNAYALWTGTSFATAKVTGELAAHLIGDPDATVNGAVEALRSSGGLMPGYGVALDI